MALLRNEVVYGKLHEVKNFCKRNGLQTVPTKVQNKNAVRNNEVITVRLGSVELPLETFCATILPVYQIL